MRWAPYLRPSDTRVGLRKQARRFGAGIEGHMYLRLAMRVIHQWVAWLLHELEQLFPNIAASVL
jgi:hypothetical protein